jgi:glycosyltransferase involved in cell wall biosynthesis
MLGFGWTPVRKGVDTMLEALKILVESGTRVVLVLVGTDELTDYLRRWPDRSCLNYVRVIPPEEFVGDLFAASDVFVSPSRAEGWPYSVAEAMANGVPVACSSIPAVSWASDAPGVFFSAPGDSEELADNVFYVAMLPKAEREKMAEQGREFIRSRHTVERWGQSVWKFYAELLGWDDSARAVAPTVAAVE